MERRQFGAKDGLARRSVAARREPRAVVRLKAACRASHHGVWVTTLILLVVGLCMMLSVSVTGLSSGGSKFAYISDQGVAAGLGLIALVLLSRLDYRRLRTSSVIFAAAVMLFLVMVHIPGLSRSEGGSASWIPLGPLTFQPSEFAKLAVVLLGAHLLTVGRKKRRDFMFFMWPLGALSLVMCGLVLLEGDMGTAVIIAGLLLGMLWIGGMKFGQWALVAGVGSIAAFAFTLSSSERMSRVFSFLNPSEDPQGASFQLNQALVALGRGGWLGVGPGQSVQKYQYLPKAHTDMIYAILGEEFGLVGAGLVVLLFAVFALCCWRLARRCDDPMGKYLIAGCGMIIVLQAVVNIGGVTGALPLTGVPLPFMSYGRNSLIVMLAAVGVILSVGRFAPAKPVLAPVEAHGNVSHIDSRRRHGGTRGAGASPR